MNESDNRANIVRTMYTQGDKETVSPMVSFDKPSTSSDLDDRLRHLSAIIERQSIVIEEHAREIRSLSTKIVYLDRANRKIEGDITEINRDLDRKVDIR